MDTAIHVEITSHDLDREGIDATSALLLKELRSAGWDLQSIGRLGLGLKFDADRALIDELKGGIR